MTEPAPIHGTTDRLRAPLRLEVHGAVQRVLDRTYRMDFQIAAGWRKEFRSYWQCTVEDGTCLVVYHDQTKGVWYRTDDQPLVGPPGAVSAANRGPEGC